MPLVSTLTLKKIRNNETTTQITNQSKRYIMTQKSGTINVSRKGQTYSGHKLPNLCQDTEQEDYSSPTLSSHTVSPTLSPTYLLPSKSYCIKNYPLTPVLPRESSLRRWRTMTTLLALVLLPQGSQPVSGGG